MNLIVILYSPYYNLKIEENALYTPKFCIGKSRCPRYKESG